MTETATIRHGARRKLSALLATALLASVLVIISPPPAAEAHNTGCVTASSHQHGNWWWRSRATHLSGSGQTLYTWERRWLDIGNPWVRDHSVTC